MSGCVTDTHLDIRRNRRKEEFVAEEDGEVVMGNVLRLELLVVIGSEVLGGMAVTVKGPALNGSVLEDTGSHRGCRAFAVRRVNAVLCCAVLYDEELGRTYASDPRAESASSLSSSCETHKR